MIDLWSLLVVPTMSLLVSPLSTRPTITVELIMVLRFLCILRLFALFTFLSLATITVRIVFAFTFSLSPALSDGAHVHRNWTRDHRVTIVVHGLTQSHPVGLLSTTIAHKRFFEIVSRVSCSYLSMRPSHSMSLSKNSEGLDPKSNMRICVRLVKCLP